VLVVYGGRSSEHSISCVSAGSILSALDRTRYEPVTVGITREGAWVGHHGDPDQLVISDGVLPQVEPSSQSVTISLDPERRGVWFHADATTAQFEPIDVVFPVLHGPMGEDGTIQGLLEIAGLPYVGSGVLASAACMDKAATKKMLQAVGIPEGDWHAFPHAEWGDPDHVSVVAGLGWPLFVKPARAGSSMGVSKVHRPDELDQAVSEAGEHDSQVIVEAGIEQAREIECGVLVGRDGVPRASVCAEIRVRAGHEFYDFEAKYLDDSADLIVPADLSPELSEQVQLLALRAFTALGCAGLARVDFFIDAAGSVLVNEINTMPGFTSISMYPRMWQASGVSYPDLINTLLAEAMARVA
jgi:D-alanine-D-alanine ligase